MYPTFHPFPRLPLELRLKIWSHLLPAPRIVDIIAISADEGRYPAPLPHDDPETFARNIGQSHWVSSVVNHLQAPRQHGNVLLYVNRETRGLILKRWKVIKDVEVLRREHMRRVAYERYVDGERGLDPKPPRRKDGWKVTGPEAMPDGSQSVFYLHPSSPSSPVLYNPEQDVLFLADPPSTRKVSSLSVMVRWLEKEIVESARFLAIPYYSWSKDNTFGHLRSLRSFEKAERVWVCFVGDDRSEEDEGWLAAVIGVAGRGERDMVPKSIDEGEAYVLEIKEQVRGDVEMESALQGWNRPVVKVIRDRGCLMDDLNEVGFL
jgi:2EXR family